MAKNKKEILMTLTSAELFEQQKVRYNAFQGGYGTNKSTKDKAMNRNSKANKRIKNTLKEYCY